MRKRLAKLAFRTDAILDNEPAMKTAMDTLAMHLPFPAIIMSTCISPLSSSNTHQCISHDITPLTNTHSNNPPSDKPNIEYILKSNQHTDTITTSTQTKQNYPPISTESNTPQQEPYSNDFTIPVELLRAQWANLPLPIWH